MAENAQEDIAKVIEELEQQVKESPDNVIAHHHLGLVYMKAGRVDDAIQSLEKALEIDPSLHLIRCRRAKILYEHRREGQAIAELELLCAAPLRGRALESTFALGAMILGRFFEQGNYNESDRILKLFGARIDQSAHLLGYAAMRHAINGQSKEAARELKKAKRLQAELPIYEHVQTLLNTEKRGWRAW